jgi:hypothetical protein
MEARKAKSYWQDRPTHRWLPRPSQSNLVAKTTRCLLPPNCYEIVTGLVTGPETISLAHSISHQVLFKEASVVDFNLSFSVSFLSNNTNSLT